MKRKFLALMLISTMTITCAACGSKSASNSADSTSKFASEISSVSKTDSNDNKTTDGAAIKESASTAADNDTSAVSDKSSENSDNSSAEIAPASVQNISSDNSNGNAGSNNSSSSNADTGSNAGNNSSDSHVNNNNSYVNNVNSDNSASNVASHTHSWDGGTVTAQPTCTENGTRTYICSCGETRTESIPALNHDMVHHDATTHSEQKVVKEGYYTHEEYYVCNGCGARFATDDEAAVHITAGDYFNSVDDYYFDDCSNYSLEYSYTYHEPEYETVEVSDNNAYDECSRCGYRQ